MSLEPRQQHRHLKRTGIIALRVAGAVAAVIAFSIGAVMLLLQTRWGGERLRRQVVARVNHQIQGELAIGRLSFGGDRLIVWDVSLRDPDGNQVAQVARAEVDFRVMRLLHEEVRLSAVVIESPRLWAESDRAREVLRRLYRPLYLIEAPIVFTAIETAACSWRRLTGRSARRPFSSKGCSRS